MDKNTPIGIVSAAALSPSNEHFFQFFITKKDKDAKDAVILGCNDIVKIKRRSTSEGNKNDYVYAVISNVCHYTDAPDHEANFVSYNFGYPSDNPNQLPRLNYCLVSAKVIYNENNVFFPVHTGDFVYLCTKEEILNALYLGYKEPNKQKAYVEIAKCIMYKGNGEEVEEEIPVMINTEYLVGNLMAHLNISGITGGAAKTTKALTIAKRIYDHYKQNKTAASIILFNTKKQDLLKIDTPKDNLNSKPKDAWFSSVSFMRPNSGENTNKITPKKKTDYYVIRFDKKNLAMLVAGDPDDSGTMYSCTKYLEDTLSEKENKKNINDWEAFRKHIDSNAQDTSNSIESRSWKKYSRLINSIIPSSTSNSIFANNKGCDLTELLSQKMDGHKIILIDIAPLKPLEQAFVFGCAISTINEVMKTQNKKVIVFVDELNKYASSGAPSSSPILKALIEMSEEGRNSGLCLMTAEQSLSVIHPRIKNNFGSQIIGRTAALELSSFDYSALPPEILNKITTFKNRDALVISPTINAGYMIAEFEDKFYKEA